MKKLLGLGLFAGLGFVFYRQLPDLRRYLRMKQM